MPRSPQPPTRRERDKQAKLERITAAASELFARHGVDEVTTQQIAEAADIGTGTLFLYARSKGDLLLLVQNAHYARALEEGRARAAHTSTALHGVMALVEQVVRCNRAHVDNGRTYLREVVFGDTRQPHRAEALSIVSRTEQAVTEILADRSSLTAEQARTAARIVSAILVLELGTDPAADRSISDLLTSIRTQVAALLPA
ncbi:MAG: helix-turn-helix domain-containing protein [Actinomyces sp.]|uniref:TetR/AcrR family transcriptional regulator n=1 Tax=Actinomyces sp. TaxID=29317 RepID=UPI0026DD4E9A|nr:TetR/AcrR family transcriptional regulator [Actinomyces sp.]MDO4244322.1 helix-turn-helix domain-containing protein [Actinomyces sp.]